MSARNDGPPAPRELDAAGIRLLEGEGFAAVPGTERHEWYDLGGQRMAYWRALELAERDVAARILANSPPTWS